MSLTTITNVLWKTLANSFIPTGMFGTASYTSRMVKFKKTAWVIIPSQAIESLSVQMVNTALKRNLPLLMPYNVIAV